MPQPSDNSLTLAQAYLRLLLATQGKRVATFLALACSVGAIGGAGLLMLVPLLKLVGVGGPQRGLAQSASTYLAAAFQRIGAPLSLGTVLIVFVVLVLCYALLNRWMQIVRSQLEYSFTKVLQDRLFSAITSADWSFFVQARSSDFTHALTSNLDRVSGGTFFFLRLLSTTVLASVHLALAVSLSPAMSVICLACFLLLWRVLGRQNSLALKTGEQVTALTESFYSQITDHLDGMKEVKSLGAEQRHRAAFESKTSALTQTRLGYTRTSEDTKFVYAAGSAWALAAMLYSAVALLQVPLAELTILIFIFSRLIPRLRDFHVSYQQILNTLPALASALDLQQRCEAAAESATESAVLEFNDSIELQGVSFCYGSAADRALSEIDLRIPARRTTAIVGASGAGKSTLADLLLGLLMPTEGRITIDGTPLDGTSLAGWRRAIGYVPQTTFLLHDTIRNNLLWGMPNASEAELQQSLRLAAADEFVAGLPNGIDTVVADRGVRLSGGERQRVALARALLRQPSVLILDEATSALDTENQLRIQRAIRRLHGELTIIIIAHRFSTVQTADRIVVLDSGRIVESGSFEELSRQPASRFRAMMDAEGFRPPETTARAAEME